MLKKLRASPRQRSTLQGNRTNRSLSAHIRKWNETTTGPLLHCHRRNHRNAQSRANHAQYAAELPALEYDLRTQPRPVARLHCRGAAAMSVAQQEKWFSVQLAQRHLAVFRELMPLRQPRKNLLRHQWKRFKLVA